MKYKKHYLRFTYDTSGRFFILSKVSKFPPLKIEDVEKYRFKFEQMRGFLQ